MLISLLLPLFFSTFSAAPEPLASIEVEADRAADGIYMLRARGGNIGASIGGDGIFLVDDQYAPLTPKIRAKLAELAGGDVPVRFVLNTHVHGDHTGGNENLGEAGALIVAHENVRKRMTTEHFGPDGTIAYVKGAPATVVPLTTIRLPRRTPRA
jgi:glyoxylase-like metal-dependent hydrolase (beta-lactamase superfamily II)